MLSTRPMFALVIGFFIFSAGHQAYTLKTNIWKYKAYNGERVQFLKAATKPGDVIICDSQPLMEHSGPLFFERIFIVAQNPHELLQYIQLLKEKGVSRIYFWTFADRLPRDIPTRQRALSSFRAAMAPRIICSPCHRVRKEA